MTLKTQTLAAVMSVAVVVGLTPALHADLVGYYAFEDTPGQLLADNSGFGNNLSTVAPGLGLSASPFLGVSSAFFNGSSFNATRNMADFTELQNATNAVTITGWIRPTSEDASDREVFYVGGAGFTDVMFYMDNRSSIDRIRAVTSDDGSTTVLDPTAAPTASDNAGVWTFVAFTWDNGTATIYQALVSDANAASSSHSPGYTDLHMSSGQFKIAQGGDTTTFAGDVDELTVWNQALSASEIELLFDGGKAGTPANQIVIPEPATVGLLGLGAALLISSRRQSR